MGCRHLPHTRSRLSPKEGGAWSRRAIASGSCQNINTLFLPVQDSRTSQVHLLQTPSAPSAPSRSLSPEPANLHPPPSPAPFPILLPSLEPSSPFLLPEPYSKTLASPLAFSCLLPTRYRPHFGTPLLFPSPQSSAQNNFRGPVL